MFGSRNDKRSSSKNIPENVSSSSIHIDQDQEEQSSVQKEKVKSVSLRKLDYPVFQTGVSGFGRIETSLVEEEDCSRQVPMTMTMMMTLMMNMIIKNSC
jgi:hypothetical protein